MSDSIYAAHTLEQLYRLHANMLSDLKLAELSAPKVFAGSDWEQLLAAKQDEINELRAHISNREGSKA